MNAHRCALRICHTCTWSAGSLRGLGARAHAEWVQAQAVLGGKTSVGEELATASTSTVHVAATASASGSQLLLAAAPAREQPSAPAWRTLHVGLGFACGIALGGLVAVCALAQGQRAGGLRR